MDIYINSKLGHSKSVAFALSLPVNNHPHCEARAEVEAERVKNVFFLSSQGLVLPKKIDVDRTLRVGIIFLICCRQYEHC